MRWPTLPLGRRNDGSHPVKWQINHYVHATIPHLVGQMCMDPVMQLALELMCIPPSYSALSTVRKSLLERAIIHAGRAHVDIKKVGYHILCLMLSLRDNARTSPRDTERFPHVLFMSQDLGKQMWQIQTPLVCVQHVSFVPYV